MVASNIRVTADALISAQVKYSNRDDESRKYDISATANIQNGKVASFDSGFVGKLTSENHEMESASIASFSSYGDRNLTLVVNDADGDETKVILDEIYAFMGEVNTTVTNNPVKA